MTTLSRVRAARRTGDDTGASMVEYSLILAGVCLALIAVAWGLRSVMSSGFTNAQTTIASDRAANVLNHVGAKAPTNLTAVAGDATITLSWDDMPDSTSYTVTNCGTTSAPTLSGSRWTVLCTGLTNGTPYVVAVTATGPGGTSSPSNATATPQAPPPSTPTVVVAIAGDTLIDVSWNAVSSATSYLVTGCGSAVVYPSDRTQPNARCTGLTNGTTYQVSVTAVNGGGSSLPSSAVPARPHPPTPAPPANLTATPGNATIQLSWSSSVGATGYKVNGCLPAVIARPATPTSYTCTGLANGTPYTVFVTATNLGGDSAGSNSVTATPAVPRPGAPTGLVAAPGNRQIVLTWGAVSGATTYTVIGCGTTIQYPANRATTGATCTGLTNGTLYTVTVTATSAAGTSDPSLPATATPAVAVSRGNSNSMNVRWTGAPSVTIPAGYTLSCITTVGGGNPTCAYDGTTSNLTLSGNKNTPTGLVTATWTFTKFGQLPIVQTETFLIGP